MRLLHDPALLSATIGRVYECVLDPVRWQTVIPELGALVGARRASLGVVSPSGTVATTAVLHGYSSDVPMLEYVPLNPILPFGLTHPPDKALVASREIGLPALQATRFYREYLRPLGDLDAVGFVVTREGDRFGAWSLVTQDDRGPVTDEEIAGLELIAPHVRRAVEISCVLGAHRLEAATYQAALGQLDSPVLILDGARRPTFTNASAEEALGEGTVLRLRDGTLRGADERVEAVLRRGAEQTLAGGGAAGFEAAVTGTDGVERLLFAVAFDAGGDGAHGSRYLMLVLRAPREDTRNPIAIAARMFALTPAQVQVLSFLAQGHAPDGIADILGITTKTVRAHLSELFGKTGTSRQAELVSRALTVASPLRQAASE